MLGGVKSKPLFSVVCIARNEAKTLPRLAKSLAEFLSRGGEWIVMDTGSTDDTIAVAESLGAKVAVNLDGRQMLKDGEVEYVNDSLCRSGEPAILQIGDSIFNFAYARNKAALLSSNEVVAMPDCDEAYTALDIDAINQAIIAGTHQFEYDFVFSHKSDGSADVQFKHCKFYDRRKLKWEGIIHEVLVNTGLGGPAVVQQLPADVIKLEHWQNHEQNRTGYLRGLALDCAYNQENERHWHYLGRELMWSGRPHSARAAFHIHLEKDGWKMEAAQSLVFLGDISVQLGDTLHAVELWHQAIQTDAGRREPWLRLAQYYQRLNDPQRTLCYTKAALAIPLTSYYANRADDYGVTPHRLLYWAYYWAGNKAGARRNWWHCLRLAPLDTQVLHDARFFLDLPKVTIVIPHVEDTREEELARCLNAIHANANYPNFDVLVEDDLQGLENLGVAKTFNRGVKKATGEYVMFLGDDCVPQPNFLILAMLASIDAGLDTYEMVGLNDGMWCNTDGPATHWLASKKMLDWLPGGVFLHEGYHHVGCDNELTGHARERAVFRWCPEAKVIHETPDDGVHRQAWKADKVAKDRALLQMRCEKYGLKTL